jgi:hypothetical protein
MDILLIVKKTIKNEEKYVDSSRISVRIVANSEWSANQYFRISFKDHHGVSCCPSN